MTIVSLKPYICGNNETNDIAVLLGSNEAKTDGGYILNAFRHSLKPVGVKETIGIEHVLEVIGGTK